MILDRERTARRIRLFNGLAVTSQIAHRILIGILLLLVLFLLLPYVDGAAKLSFLRPLKRLDYAVVSSVRSWVAVEFGGRDMSRWVAMIGVFALSQIMATVSLRCRDKVTYLRFKHNYEQWTAQMNLSNNAVVLSPLNEILEKMRRARSRDRSELVRVFAETKRKLDEMGRDLAFLAIDVVDSTGMKLGEEQAAVIHDFAAYRSYVEEKLDAHHCLKKSWTPDGVMSCFATIDAAVATAQDVIKGLSSFNRDVKTIRRDFALRCGINAGYVYFDESIALDEISDRVIDIAGHLQKCAKPNTVCMAKPAIEPLQARQGFKPSGDVVHGYEVYEWRDGGERRSKMQDRRSRRED